MIDGVFHANMVEGYAGGICFLASAWFRPKRELSAKHGLLS